MSDRAKVVSAFCDECVWVRAIRTHLAELYESGDLRKELLAKSGKQFFYDLHFILIEYVMLQLCKLTDPASSGGDKNNLTAEYVLKLGWSDSTTQILESSLQRMRTFRTKIEKARSKIIAHADLRTHMQELPLGGFAKEEEDGFWNALQEFVTAAHDEANGGPFEIDASMPEGDALTLLRCLADAADYEDLVNEESSVLLSRVNKRRYDNL